MLSRLDRFDLGRAIGEAQLKGARASTSPSLRGRLKLSLRDSGLVRGLEPVGPSMSIIQAQATGDIAIWSTRQVRKKKTENNIVLDPRT